MKCVYNDAGRCNLFTNEWANGICTNNEDCPYRKTMTNADKIRAMTDEELADFINDAEWGFIDRPGMCDVCDHNLNSPKKCLQCWLDWLKQEVQND